MRIQKINSNQYNSKFIPKNFNKQKFLGLRLPNQTFEAFSKWAEKTDFVSKVPEIIRCENVVGEGLQNKIYEIGQNIPFLLRVFKGYSTQLYTKPIMKSFDYFSKYNIGQTIALVRNDLKLKTSIILKQNGTPNGIQNWRQIFSEDNFSKSNVPEFISKLQDVVDMPQSAYDELLKEVKLIAEKKFYFDFFNPQNVLLDKENKAFNLVDIENLGAGNNLSTIPSAILYSLVDEFNFTNAYNFATHEKKEQMLVYAMAIKLKIKKSAQKHFIANNPKIFEMNRIFYYDSLKLERLQDAKKILGNFSC
jgi:hypothetical protein